jgi:hypothetical protein
MDKFEKFALVACLVGVFACIFATVYQLGNERGRVAGMATSAEQVQQCEQMGASGYIIGADGVACLYN